MTVEVRDVIDALSTCVALARLVIAATVSLWTSVALFAWNPAERTVWEESTSSACAMTKSVLNCVQVFWIAGFLIQSLQSSWNMPVEAMTLNAVLTTWIGVKDTCPAAANSTASSILSTNVSMGRFTSYAAFMGS